MLLSEFLKSLSSGFQRWVSIWTQGTDTSFKWELHSFITLLWSGKKILSVSQICLYSIKLLYLPHHHTHFLKFSFSHKSCFHLFQWFVHLSTICSTKLFLLIICLQLSCLEPEAFFLFSKPSSNTLTYGLTWMC